MAKISVAILGSGNIGTYLMYKVRRNAQLELKMVAGIEPASEGLALARKLGYETCDNGIEGILQKGGIDLVLTRLRRGLTLHTHRALKQRVLSRLI